MEEAPFFAEIAEGPEGGHAFWVRADDGVRLRIAYWPISSSDPQGNGTVFVAPGRSGYIERYGHLAKRLRVAGLGTYVIDWRGHGLSDRLTEERNVCHVGRFTDYQHDLDAMMQAACDLDLPRPWMLIGNSMGAAIALRGLIRGMEMRATAFVAPMWGITLPAVVRPVASLLSKSARLSGFGERFVFGQDGQAYFTKTPFEENTMTGNADEYAYWQSQAEAHPELTIGGVSFGWLNEALKECRALSSMPSPVTPCLAMCGEADGDVDKEAIRNRMEHWPNGNYVLVPEGHHDLLYEVPKIREAVTDQVLDLFESGKP
ncbi:alpha/beta hydrolase [Palleronia marisminoris]|uniref:alpha/beta hydrolase n=1 Tax=Palleronia marisminoris TaxID=315423 RepID=UPI000AD2AE6F|nr:alpha/beta hydrolase [Palleronia marisminoris]